jgi:hypothetical protein
MLYLWFCVIIFLNSINKLICVTVKCGVLFEVQTEFLNIVISSQGSINNGSLLH